MNRIDRGLFSTDAVRLAHHILRENITVFVHQCAKGPSTNDRYSAVAVGFPVAQASLPAINGGHGGPPH